MSLNNFNCKVLIAIFLIVFSKVGIANCLEKNDLLIKFFSDFDNQDLKQVKISEQKTNKLLYTLETIFVKSGEPTYSFRDLNFDKKDEILIEESILEENKSFHVLSLNCEKIEKFKPEMLTNFSLNQNKKEITEWQKNGAETIINKYCLNNNQYYLCFQQISLLNFNEKTVFKVEKFDQKGNILQKDFMINDDFINLSKKISRKNLVQYNDIGFYLEQEGKFEEAIFILEKIVTQYPTRTVAHLNLADAYFSINDLEKAKQHYQIYKNQMIQKNKENIIPERVFERLAK